MLWLKPCSAIKCYVHAVPYLLGDQLCILYRYHFLSHYKSTSDVENASNSGEGWTPGKLPLSKKLMKNS